MFNAANILEALKNYIRTRGGTSNAYNIAEAVNDLNSIPQGSGGDIPPEVENAIETHGMGWTDTEEKAGFDIQWAGDVTGLESFDDTYYKVNSDLHGITSVEDLIGANITAGDGYETETMVLSEEDILEGEIINGLLITPNSLGFGLCIIAFDDAIESETRTPISKGVWFAKKNDLCITRLYKEATTEEVVHQIDQKYIPQGSGGDIPPEVTNAIETHGMGWTDEEEVVHQIDQKYIPQSSGGGGMVVTIDFDGETGIADKTYAEIVAAISVGNYVIVKAMSNGETFMYIPVGVIAVMGDGFIIAAQFGDVLIQCESGTTWTMQ